MTGYKQTMKSLIADRNCGSCFECCIHTGVSSREENGRIGLRTYAGKSCQHLAPDTPAKACAVYSRRPFACERYKCLWLQGVLADENMRPDISGIILGFYGEDNQQPNSATLVVCDETKCGSLTDPSSPIGKAINYATNVVDDIKIVNYKTRNVMYLKDGKILIGRLTKPSDPESLEFTFDRYNPIGRYKLIKENEQ